MSRSRLFPAAFALFAVSACSPEAAPPATGDKKNERAEPAAKASSAENPGAPAQLIAPARTAVPRPSAPRAAAAPPGERRCGWLHNPTPGNWWLFDGHGEWILATQGGYQAEGMDEMPDMTTRGWEETNGHYGYGCACMVVTADPGTHRVKRIASATPKPLKQCRADRSLPKA